MTDRMCTPPYTTTAPDERCGYLTASSAHLEALRTPSSFYGDVTRAVYESIASASLLVWKVIKNNPSRRTTELFEPPLRQHGVCKVVNTCIGLQLANRGIHVAPNLVDLQSKGRNYAFNDHLSLLAYPHAEASFEDAILIDGNFYPSLRPFAEGNSKFPAEQCVITPVAQAREFISRVTEEGEWISRGGIRVNELVLPSLLNPGVIKHFKERFIPFDGVSEAREYISHLWGLGHDYERVAPNFYLTRLGTLATATPVAAASLKPWQEQLLNLEEQVYTWLKKAGQLE